MSKLNNFTTFFCFFFFLLPELKRYYSSTVINELGRRLISEYEYSREEWKKKNDTFSHEKRPAEENMTTIAVNFISVESAEKRRI